MSTELIVILSVLGIAALIGLFYVSHSIEKQRREKALMIASLTDSSNRLQRIFDSVPAPYLSKDLRLLLLAQIKKRLEKLVDLAPQNDRYRKSRDGINEQIANATEDTSKQPKPNFKTPEEAAQLRKVLQELSKLVENFMQNKVIDATEARKHLATIQNSFFEANLSYMIQVAESAKREGKLKVAILNYEKVIKEMQKRNQKGAYNEKISGIQTTINELKAEAGTQPEEQNTTPGGELTQAMDEMMEEEESWKKKYF